MMSRPLQAFLLVMAVALIGFIAWAATVPTMTTDGDTVTVSNCDETAHPGICGELLCRRELASSPAIGAAAEVKFRGGSQHGDGPWIYIAEVRKLRDGTSQARFECAFDRDGRISVKRTSDE
jgi:hypothetical protein